ncbi:MAG: ribbon-helix-helix domain-containing protein [Gemmatimonadota bacterium]
MIYHHTMSKTRIGITLDERSVERLDSLVKKSVFENRSQAIQQAVDEKLERIDRTRLARECAKLDPTFEKAMAEEGLGEDLEAWPEY